MAHEEAAELLGAYALDAVEPDEAEALEAHLETCPRCRSELRNHREVVGLLAYTGHDAPEGLWDRLSASIHDPAEDDGPSAPVLELRSPAGLGLARPGRAGASQRRTRTVRWLGLAAAAAVALVALLGVEVDRLENRTNHLSNQVASMSGAPTMAAVRSAITTPGAEIIQLRPPAGGSTQLDAVILPSGAGYLYNSNLAPLPASRTYQLWGMVGGQVISYGVLGSTLSGVESFRSSTGVSSLAVTDEVAGGVVRSVQPAVVFGSIE